MDVRIDASPDELRRLLGQPALLPLYETLALAFERWLMALVSRSVTETGTGAAGACEEAPAPVGPRRRARSA